MNPLDKIMRWISPVTDTDPAAQAEAQRIRHGRETIKASQQGGLGQLGNFGNVPPTPDVLDPKSSD